MKGSYKSRWVIVIVVVIAAIAAFWFWQGRNDSQSAAPGATKQAQQSPAGGRRGMRSGPLAPVQAATAVEQAVPRYLTGLGTITAANTVTVRSRVDGQLMALHFREGQQVKAGDLLAEIDPSQFKVALAQARGQLAKDKATLANARRDLARYQQLAKTNLVSRQELDAQQALVSETEGTIKADEASVASAQLQLDWSRITAPVDGRVGLKQVDVGNQISSGDTTGIVVITQTHPIDLVFTLPESDIATVVQAQKAGKPLVVEAWDRTNSKKLSEGTLLSLDNQIDATTGTIKVKARFNNQDDALFPNQFVNARMLVDTEQNAVVIPTAALQMGNEGHFVWVLNSENKVSKHLVTPGIQDSQKVVIRAGISAGDRVVTDGIDRLTEGAKVEVVEAQSATTPEEKATSREYAKKEHAPDAGVTPEQHRRPVAPFYYASCRHHAADGGDLTRRDYRLSRPARFGAAGSGLSDHSGGHALPSASPDVMTSAVTAPLERQFGQMSGLKQMSSQSSGGASVITLQFQLTLPLDVAEQEVQAAINAATNLLPSDLPNPPVYSKVNPADPPIMTLAVTSTAMPMTQVEDMVETRVAQKISQISGVGLVTLSGGQRPAVRVKLNAQAIAALGLTSETVRTAITGANVNSAKGSLDGPSRAVTLSANDQMQSAEEYRQLIIAYQNGAPIRLGDVATVEQGAENSWLGAWANKEQAIVMNVQRQPGANIISTADSIRQMLPQLTESLPKSVKVTVLSDRTTNIRASVNDTQFELMMAIALVVMIIYLFLRNIPATIIPGFAVPLSLIGTFAVMVFLDFSINNLTLMALTIATGFVVDDAIVVIENISRYIEKGEKPLAAALKGAGEIGFTIISLTFSLIAVLIPLLFMGDIVGRLFREFAITTAVAILISAVVSLTLTPMMCARMLSQESLRKQNRFSRASEKMFDRIIAAYGRGLAKVLNHPWLTLSVALSTLLLSVLLWVFIPKGFFPVQDNGIIQGTLQAPQSSSFANMAQRQRQVADVILQDPAVQSLTSFVGVDGTNPSLNSARLQINLKPLDERDDRVQKVIARLQTAVDKVPGVDLFLQPTQDLTIDTQVSRTQYQFTLQATSLDALSTWVPELMEKLQQLPQLSDVSSDWQDKGLVAYVNVDRDSASRLGISMADVDNALYNAFGQRLISTIYTQANQYRVVLEHNTENTPGLAALDTIRLTSSDGGVVPLSSIAKIEQRFAPLSINHLDQFPVTTISFNVPDNYSLGDAVQAIMDTEKTLNLPVDITTQFRGSTLAFQSALGSTVWLIVAAVVAMYIVLGILYESFIHPITILSTLPTAGVGALLALMIAGSELDVIAIIGIILLIGIVKKNAIMMIDFALAAEREQGMSPRDAIYQACLLRFRPILMTTPAALLGALPLMLSTGVGAELRRPLGIGMVGGLIVSQVLTLFTTPVIYLLFDRLALWTKSRFARHEEEA